MCVYSDWEINVIFLPQKSYDKNAHKKVFLSTKNKKHTGITKAEIFSSFDFMALFVYIKLLMDVYIASKWFHAWNVNTHCF